MTQLKKYKLGDCLSMIQNGAQIKQRDGAGGIPITRIETLSNDLFNRDRLGYANVFDAERYSGYILQEDDILMSHINSRAYLGRSVQYHRHGDEIIIHGMNLLRIQTNPSILDSHYAYYFFHTPYFKSCVDNIRIDAVNQSSINITNICNIEIELPSLEEQKRIASVLSNLDRKIELNRQINANLEALARQLYDYWFVQFDFPDANGKPYKSSGGKMVYNEKLQREIPLGWENSKMEDMCVMYQPQTLGLSDLAAGGQYLVYGANGTIGTYHEYNHEKSEIAMACRGSSCGTLNRTMPKSWITGNAMVIKLKDEAIHNEFIYHALSYVNIAGAITGSGQPQLTRTNIEKLSILRPTKDVLLLFSKRVVPIVDLQINIKREIASLTRQRDKLLPLLMNGQVTIK